MIRFYRSGDKIELIKLLRLHTPQYFHPSEENDFVYYLDHYAENYFVVEENGQIIGAGGINYPGDPSTARISWDIIHPAWQGKGIGKKLIEYRIDKIKENTAVDKIVVRTSQLVFRFYEKMGFVLEKTEKNFWAKDFDLYQMKMKV